MLGNSSVGMPILHPLHYLKGIFANIGILVIISREIIASGVHGVPSPDLDMYHKFIKPWLLFVLVVVCLLFGCTNIRINVNQSS